MSFIKTPTTGKVYAPGYFLAYNDENCVRETRTILASGGTTAGGGKYVPMGTIYPANNSTAEGILYEDVDVTTGDMPGSVVTKGIVYEDKLPVQLDSNAKTALIAKGFKFIATSPEVVRPKWTNDATLAEITVTSTEGATSGKTHLEVSGYTPTAGESYYYKVGNATTAPSVTYGLPLDNTWSAFTDDTDYTVTDTYKVTVASVDSTGAVVAAGSATADSKA